jgi:hypothetical protein
VQELMQALEDANARVHDLETNTRRWKEDAEAAEARIARISREKAAAEKAADVLESLLSHNTHLSHDVPPAYSFNSGSPQFEQEAGEIGGIAPVMAATGAGAGRRRPPAVNADQGMTPTHLAYSTPYTSNAPTTPTPTIPMSLSHPHTPTSSHTTGMAPIGTPTRAHTHNSTPSGTHLRNIGGGVGLSRVSSHTPSENSWSTAPGTPVKLSVHTNVCRCGA